MTDYIPFLSSNIVRILFSDQLSYMCQRKINLKPIVLHGRNIMLRSAHNNKPAGSIGYLVEYVLAVLAVGCQDLKSI